MTQAKKKQEPMSNITINFRGFQSALDHIPLVNSYASRDFYRKMHDLAQHLEGVNNTYSPKASHGHAWMTISTPVHKTTILQRLNTYFEEAGNSGKFKYDVIPSEHPVDPHNNTEHEFFIVQSPDYN